MTLLDDFNEAMKSDLQSKIVAALSLVATDMLLESGFSSDPQYTQKAKFIKACLSATPDAVRFVARAMVSQGLSNATPDGTLQTAITNNFGSLAILYDPTLEV